MSIRILDKHVANQIAAGEVVERPSSVVKELVENAIDSGARRIDVDIERGGLRLIRVRDNGCGIPKEDLTNALERHATSKISKADDLREIMSLGFRGEALASIAAVSRLVLSSRMAGHRSAWRVQVEGPDHEASLVPVAHNDGTTVEVRDLFYNLPARRKFLRTEKTEFNHIEELLRRLALSRFDIGISFKHNKRTIFEFKPAHDILGKEQRLAKLYSSAFMRSAVSIDIERNGLQLVGWIAVPEFNRSQSDLQSFFVNSRVIRDKLITHAVRQAFGDAIPEGRYPAYSLALNLDTELVDVNVHPTKHEVRFSDARLVHDFIVSATSEALERSQEVVNAKFDQANTDTVRPVSHLDDYVELVSPNQLKSDVVPYQLEKDSLDGDFTDYLNAVIEPDVAYGPLGKSIAQVQDRFLVAENDQGLVLLNIEQAQRLIILSRLRVQLEHNAVVVQPLLIPETIDVNVDLLANFERSQASLKVLGVDIDLLSEDSVILRKMPSLMRHADFDAFVIAGLTYLHNKKRINQERLLAELLKSVVDAKRNRLSLQEMNILLRDLEKLDADVYKSIWKQIKQTELAKLC